MVEEKLPLFDQSGKRNPYGFVTCPTCHDVHQGPEGRAMRLEDRDPPRLCLSCHVEKTSLLGSTHDPRGEGEGASCDLCHPVHSEGEWPPLWELRVEGHGSWNDRKCSPCHGPPEDEPVPHAGPGSHPTDVSLRGDMKSPHLPLYDPLGGVPGRLLTCSTCHDLHGTPDASGGVLPNYLRTDNRSGQLCGGCHAEEMAVVGTPHDLHDQGFSDLGPCGPCHTAHQAATPRYLWGMEPAAGDYLPNTLCRSCHLQGGMVQGEFLLLQHHMKDAETLRSPRGTIYLQRPMLMLDEWALKTGKPPVIPLYQKNGDAGPDGNLQCVSCHVPHQWSPMGPFLKPGFGSVGPNVPTRFLRLRDARAAELSACAVCHPDDSVQRYQRYHHVWEDLGEEFR
jgi:predicted CXXCH cytochrome family protein